MSTEKQVGEVFLLQARQHVREEFLPKIQDCLSKLTEEDIWWRGDETNNSVGNLLLHLAGNVRQWIVSGVGGEKDIRQRASEFSERRPLSKEELWRKLEDAVADADRVLARFSPEHLLDSRHIQKYDLTALQAIFHVVEHFSYHTGQIIYITKLKRKTDLKFYDL